MMYTSLYLIPLQIINLQSIAKHIQKFKTISEDIKTNELLLFKGKKYKPPLTVMWNTKQTYNKNYDMKSFYLKNWFLQNENPKEKKYTNQLVIYDKIYLNFRKQKR